MLLNRRHEVVLAEPQGHVGFSRRSCLSGVAALVLPLASPPSVLAHRKKPPEKSCVNKDDWGSVSVRSGSIFTFEWTLRGRKRQVSFDLGNRFSAVKAYSTVRRLPHDHSPENYLRMAAYDPYRHTLLAALARKLIRSAKMFQVSPLENVIAFVQSIPHCDIGRQRWPTESLLNGVADCSDKSVLAAALIEEVVRLQLGLGRESRYAAADRCLWLFFRRPGHITIGLLKRYCHDNNMTIHKDGASSKALGQVYFFSELNGSPHRKIGQWSGTFPRDNWMLIIPYVELLVGVGNDMVRAVAKLIGVSADHFERLAEVGPIRMTVRR